MGKETQRSLYLNDLFKITCKRCGSTDIDLETHECDECGITITAECNYCYLKYKYHNFKQITATYDEKGNEIFNDLNINSL